MRVLIIIGFGCLSAIATPIFAGTVPCSPGDGTTYDLTGNGPTVNAPCNFSNCAEPRIVSVSLSSPPGCDPFAASCAVTAVVPLEFPGNHQNDAAACGFICSFARVNLRTSAGALAESCGTPGNPILQDLGTLTVTRSVSCGNSASWRYDVEAVGCPDQPNVTCRKFTTEPLFLGASLGCERPKSSGCGDESGAGAGTCCVGPGGAAPAAGGGRGSAAPLRGAATQGTPPLGIGLEVPGGGPLGLRVIYQSDGAGGVGLPEALGWKAPLGRFWSHRFTSRIVRAPNDLHVWLITPAGTFREFTDGDGDGLYEQVLPTDEYRELNKTPSGWTFRELDGTEHLFTSGGLWSSTVDRHGNTTSATYTGTRLDRVNFPDGRRFDFVYDSAQQVQTVTEVGVGGGSSRSWGYGYGGGTLTTIHRPDGTTASLLYGSGQQTGLLLRWTEVGSGPEPRPSRVMGAWEFDTDRQLLRAWSGDTSFGGANAVNKHEWTYPTANTSTLTHHLGPGATQVASYTFDREFGSGKPRVTAVSGDCPSCSFGPNSQRVYADGDHPLRATREIDGRGNFTDLAYDNHGMLLTRTEAVGTPRQRTTSWTYDTTYPALVETITVPSTAGAGNRVTTTIYSPEGDPEQVTETGTEAGAPFSYTTLSAFNSAGQVLSTNPPGYGTDDVTSFSYDPARGNLVPLTRTDPLVGTTTFHHDAFNRRVGVTDVKGVLTESRYDALDRVTHVIERAGPATPGDPIQPGDLVTRHFYNPFGDLGCTQFPRGNGISRVYDSAGRLLVVRQGITLAEPTLTACFNIGVGGTLRQQRRFTLNGLGQRLREDLEQETAPNVFASIAATEYVYSTRCHLDKVIQAPGTPEEAVTENAYDCNGNLERSWDANHLSNNQANPATAVYGYDELDRLTTVTQPWGGAGGGTVVTRYGYDVQDHLTSVIDGEGTVTSYVHSDRGLMTSEVSLVSGTSTHGYNEHGELVTTLDARGIISTRTVDALDRVTHVDYPGAASDLSYVYDDPLVAFSKGQLTKITRGNGEVVSYGYDRFGRVLQDGALAMTYDANSNVATKSYPGNVVASFGYDFADRETSLSVQVGGGSVQTLVSGATYLPLGPLATLSLGNGLTETRSSDRRYSPTRIQVPGRLDWAYATDDIGNPTAITQTVPSAQARTYGYQDYQYYLTSGTGPWPGPLSWTYDRIGNRLSETRGALTDAYTYLPNNTTGGRTAVLESIELGTLGTREFNFGPAGHIEQVTAGGAATAYAHDEEGRLTRLFSTPAKDGSALRYDGRGFLAEAQAKPLAIFEDSFENGTLGCWNVNSGGPAGSTTGCFVPPARPVTRATYSSAGVLHSLLRESGTREHLFYLAGRPVAQLAQPVVGANTLTFLTTDHLGTPVLATNEAGASVWSGGFEPFGTDFSGASAAGVFLRFPGQWVDGGWGSSASQELSYNLHRWYDPANGKYLTHDPVASLRAQDDRRIGNLRAGEPVYSYAINNPASLVDPLGLSASRVVCLLRWTTGGAALGGVTGALVGGSGGTLVGLPGGPAGSVILGGAGAGAGFFTGTPIGAVAGVAIGYFACGCIDSPADRVCPPCSPPVGSIGYRLDRVPPSRPHWPFSGDHVHLFQMNQNPLNCQCFWQPLGVQAPPPPTGAYPL